MALLEKQSKARDRISTASMADIAFLLLIFFLTTTVFEEAKGLPIVLPEAMAPDAPIPQKNLVHFLVQANGTVIVRRGGARRSRSSPPTRSRRS